jgi:hypothetical protein
VKHFPAIACHDVKAATLDWQPIDEVGTFEVDEPVMLGTQCMRVAGVTIDTERRMVSLTLRAEPTASF